MAKKSSGKVAHLRVLREQAYEEAKATPNLPAVKSADAKLPQAYEAAKLALADCEHVDECKDWADKAAALASYARQADDDDLLKHATRIRARAVRRAGELLKTFKQAPEERLPQSRQTLSTGAHTQEDDSPRSQREAADAAGMSKHQEAQAVRVASVPEDDFEDAVESESPPSVTKLAKAGTGPRLVKDDEPEKPEGFYEATHTMGAMRRFAERCDKHTPESIAGGLLPSEHPEARSLVQKLDHWLDRFVVNLEGS